MKLDKIISSVIAILGSAVNYLWGGWDMALRTLLLFMLLDYILGVICGIKDKKLSSDIAFKGISDDNCTHCSCSSCKLRQYD